jgi:hypothetical protein
MSVIPIINGYLGISCVLSLIYSCIESTKGSLGSVMLFSILSSWMVISLIIYSYIYTNIMMNKSVLFLLLIAFISLIISSLMIWFS